MLVALSTRCWSPYLLDAGRAIYPSLVTLSVQGYLLLLPAASYAIYEDARAYPVYAPARV